MANRLLEGPSGSKGQSLDRNLMIDAARGQIRVRAWPKKRGKPKSPVTIEQNNWFRDCLALIKRLEPGFMERMYTYTKGTPLLPRDLAMMIIAGRFCYFKMADGTRMFSEVVMVEVSEALDVISQAPGSIMIRGEEVWSYFLVGDPGFLLAAGAAGENPVWIPPPESGAVDRYGWTNLQPKTGSTFALNNFGGLVYVMPKTAEVESILWRVRTANAASKITPAIYAIDETGNLGALLASGPQVTGVTAGENIFPLTAPLGLAAGQMIAFGVQALISSVSATNAPGAAQVSFGASGALPNPAPASASAVGTWGGFQLIPLTA